MRGRSLHPGERGDISVRKLPSGGYEAQCRYMDPSGKVSRPRKRGATYAAARRGLEDALSRDSTYQASTMGELLTLWLDAHQGILPATRKHYLNEISWYLLPTVGDIRLADMTSALAQHALDRVALTHSRDAAKRARGRLLQASRWGMRVSIIDRDFSLPPSFLERNLDGALRPLEMSR